MRDYPATKEDKEESKKLKAEPWMLKLLKLNPEYVYWGNGEDYMWTKEGSWNSSVSVKSVKELWNLDELNECVNFYFSVNRESKDCEACHGQGLNPETFQLSEDFYDFDHTGKKWCDKITQNEVVALQKAGRLTILVNGKWVKKENLTAEEVNAANKTGGDPEFKHDGINRWILIETRAKRLGIFGHCKECEGLGYIYTKPTATVSLQLWMIHPRKGASRGLLVEEVKEDEIPIVMKWLKEAEKRNSNRFKKIKNYK